MEKTQDTPEFLFNINRYIGSEITGDRGEFWARGVIKFATQVDSTSYGYSKIKGMLQKDFGPRIQLEALPVLNEHNRLQFAQISDGESEAERAEFDLTASPERRVGRVSSETKRRYSLRLNDHEADLYWQQFHANRLSVSLSYGWDIDGVIRDETGAWTPHHRSINDSLSIAVSPSIHPDLFKKSELWQRLTIAHSGIKVLCYDFLNEVIPDLYYTLVEFRFETITGRRYVRQLKFLADSDEFETDIDFELANDIKEGFEYRVRRLTVNGDVMQSDWTKHDKAWLDVSLPITTEKNNDETVIH